MREEVLSSDLVKTFVSSFGDAHLKNVKGLAFKNNEVIDMLIIDAKIKNIAGVISAYVFKIVSEPNDYILANIIVKDKTKEIDIIREIFETIPSLDGIKSVNDLRGENNIYDNYYGILNDVIYPIDFVENEVGYMILSRTE